MGSPQSYGEACRFAFALDVVGRRWALLIVRELLLGPKRFTDIRNGLPHASSNILSERLRELEESGVVTRRTLPPPFSARVYELTEWGRELEPIVTRLGAWGARAPVAPGCREIGTDSVVLALRSLFDPAKAADHEGTYALTIAGQRFTVTIADGEIELGREDREEPSAAFEAESPAAFAALLSGQVGVDEAVASGAIQGAKRALRRFLSLFPMPEPAAPAAAP